MEGDNTGTWRVPVKGLTVESIRKYANAFTFTNAHLNIFHDIWTQKET